jgi:hypothetical protein
MSYYSVLHWSALTREKQEIIDLQGRVAPCEVQGFTSRRLFQLGIFLQGVVFGVWFFFLRYKLIFFVQLQKHQGNFSEGFSRTQVSALAVKNNLLVTGGFRGEIICKVIPTLNLLPCFRFPQANVVRF